LRFLAPSLPKPKEESSMARFFTAITRVLRNETTIETVHFHAGPAGPYVCEDPRCTSPALDPEAA
jgi:hypothetical protein